VQASGDISEMSQLDEITIASLCRALLSDGFEVCFERKHPITTIRTCDWVAPWYLKIQLKSVVMAHERVFLFYEYCFKNLQIMINGSKKT
jgi:hypothetical protein